jgi:hypothetical protein
MTSADLVIRDARQSRSFAGLFAYSSNVPMKVFAGNEPCVPVSVVVDALDTIQQGGASKHEAAHMKKHMDPGMSACQEVCMQEHAHCMLAPSNAQACVSQAQA